MACDVPKSSNYFKVFSQSSKDSFVRQEINEEDVNSSIDKIKIASSEGIHEIPPKFVKLLKCVLFPVLTKLFNKCVQQELFLMS